MAQGAGPSSTCRKLAPEKYLSLMSKWTLNFKDPKFEEVYRCKEGALKGQNDYGCVLLQMVHSIGELWLAWKRWPPGQGYSQWTVLSSPGRPSVSGCLRWHTFVSACCIAMLIIQLVFAERYQRHRLCFLSIFMAVMWSCESVRCYCNEDSVQFMVSKIVYPCVIVAFGYNVPWSIHVRARVLGFVLQLFGFAARGNCYETRFFAFVLLVSHGLGSLLAYVLDRRSRIEYLKSLPEFYVKAMLRDPSRTTEMPEDVRSLPICKEFWKVFCPSLPAVLNESHQLVAKALQEATEEAGRGGRFRRRPLGGFAGAFAEPKD